MGREHAAQRFEPSSELDRLFGREVETVERIPVGALEGHWAVDLVKAIKGELLFHPIRLDPAILADAYPDTLADALEPVDEALAHLAAALPEFNRLIEAAQSHFGRQAIEATPPG